MGSCYPDLRKAGSQPPPNFPDVGPATGATVYSAAADTGAGDTGAASTSIFGYCRY